MPLKRFKRTKQTEKKKNVTSTLLSITLKVENYLYAKETISVQQAKDYIIQISKLKIENSDARSRQVSEKLTHMLKALINEYSNKITDDENSNILSSNYNVEKKLHENFDTQLNENVNISPEFSEAFVLASNTVNSQNDLTEPDNIEDRRDINNNISISIDNMSENLPPKEGLPVKNNNDNNKNPNKSLIVGNSDRKGEQINKENIAAFTNETKTEIDPKCVNNTNNVKRPSRNKNINSQKKQKNDLKWIENIKFVREVDTEEHIGSHLEPSFWYDLTKPDICSHDFEAD